jgi:hypothetical protein
VLQSIRTLFGFATSGLRVGQEVARLLRQRRGEARALLEELKANQDLCAMVLEEGSDPMKVIPALQTSQYDRLLASGFDFDSLRGSPIAAYGALERSDLASFIGKGSGYLVEDIYDKTKELERRFRLDRDNARIDWRRRIINLYKRMLLLIHHLRARRAP